jgi:hypothetical protein
VNHKSVAENLFSMVDHDDDPGYQKVAKADSYGEVRSYINKLWELYKPYADAKFPSQFRKDFYSRLWELWLGNYLLAEKFELRYGGKSEWPDFHTMGNEQEILIEAICVGNADTEDAIEPLPEVQWSAKDHQYVAEFAEVRFEKYELRYHRAINRKYSDNVQKLRQMKLSYVIAISGAKLPNSKFCFGETVPAIVKTLFPIGDELIGITEQQNFSVFRERKRSNLDYKGAEKTKEIFSSDRFSLISGVIFSAHSFVCNKNNLKEGLILIRNPFAKYPLSDTLGLAEYDVRYSDDTFSIHFKENEL